MYSVHLINGLGRTSKTKYILTYTLRLVYYGWTIMFQEEKNPNLRSKHPDVPHVNQNLNFLCNLCKYMHFLMIFFRKITMSLVNIDLLVM